jgi:hypothetical protein
MLSVENKPSMLSVILLNVVMLNVIALKNLRQNLDILSRDTKSQPYGDILK